MVNALKRVIDRYDRGAIDRRQFMNTLLVLTASTSAATAAQSTDRAIAPALSLNHVHLDVADIDRSVKFYGDVLGAETRDTAPNNVTLRLPGQPTWISLTKTDEPGHYNHVGYGVKFDSAKRIAADLNAMYPESRARETGDTVEGSNTRSVYFYDPDGIRFQIVPSHADGWLPSGVVGSQILKGERR